MPNRLAAERSPYLQQHAGQPVDWYPWGGDALARARAEQKPLFVSIGYSTCHWCHVMAHESFEDPEIAALLNEHFVPVKVDREERPDVDRVYMTYVQAASGRGGWPLSVWLTPDLKPFHGGTYFPPRDVAGRAGFATVLRVLARAWATEREAVVGGAERVTAALRENFQNRDLAEPSSGVDRVPAASEQALEFFAAHFDQEHGGFGAAPKFPSAPNLQFLLHLVEGKGPEAGRAREMLELTLERMADGGIHDQIGGGFHRYSVDNEWFVPHFEKMLPDQAQLASVYLEAYRLTGRPRFAAVARDTLSYALRDLRLPGGAFASGEDADSPTADGTGHTEEGAFYFWTLTEVEQALGADAPWVQAAFGLRPEGNLETSWEMPAGRNLPRRRPLGLENARAADPVETWSEDRLAAAVETLRRVRAQRPRPARDDKVVTAWNGLMVSALATASRLLGDESFLNAAVEAAEFVHRNLFDGPRGILFRSHCGVRSDVEGFAPDYALWIQGLVDLYEASDDVRWLQQALELQERMDNLFRDPRDGGYYDAAGGEAASLLRLKEEQDGAEPAASAVAVENLRRLAALSGREEEWKLRAVQTVAAFAGMWTEVPHAMPAMLRAGLLLGQEPGQIVLTGNPTSEGFRAMRKIIHRRAGNRNVYSALDDAGWSWLRVRAPWLAGLSGATGEAKAYLCDHYTCGSPVADAATLESRLA